MVWFRHNTYIFISSLALNTQLNNNTNNFFFRFEEFKVKLVFVKDIKFEIPGRHYKVKLCEGKNAEAADA